MDKHDWYPANELKMYPINDVILTGRPAKLPRSCTWCSELKAQLKYVFPTSSGKREFCSEMCLSEYRKALMKVRVFVYVCMFVMGAV